MHSSFDRIAKLYDSLARFIFSNRLIESQISTIEQIAPDSNVLVLGGGTGEILFNFHDSNDVVFVEKSERMLSLAKRRVCSSRVSFYHSDFLRWETPDKFDYIFCPFFLDLFSEDDLQIIFDKIRVCSKENTKLLIVDFNGSSSNLFHKLVLKLMYLFFYCIGAINIFSYNGFWELLDKEFSLDTNAIINSKAFVISKVFRVNPE